MNSWATKLMIAGLVVFAAIPAARADTSSSGHVGALEYIEGHAFVDGKPVAGNQEKLPILNEGSILGTGKGHAEMLLTPGVFLRLGANSQVSLISAGLADTDVRLNRGAAMLEVNDLHKDNLIRVQVGSESGRVLKTGLYRLDAQPGEVEVLSGKMAITEGDRVLNAGKHREVQSADFRVERMKTEPDDDLSRWSRLRSEYESEASISSAQYVYDMGMPWAFSDWFWNPWFDTWSWLPASGFCLNPYGFGYWSPGLVHSYYPFPYYGYRQVHFVPRQGRLSPSGLNLQRGAAVRMARSGMVAARGFSPSHAGGGMRSFGGGMMGRSMGGGFRGGR